MWGWYGKAPEPDREEQAADHRPSLEHAVGIAQEVCQGLDFAHGRGIVPRYLKPANV